MKPTVPFLFLIMLATLAPLGCATHSPQADPLAGFQFSSLENLETDKPITEDYKEYIRGLSYEESKSAGPILYFKNDSGEHAVVIMIGINGRNWRHILIYDKNDRRVKTIKYASGDYHS